MEDREWKTDEDRKIYQLTVHRDLIGWVIRKLEEAGIACERTMGDDPNGDILYYRTEDEEKVKMIVRQIQKRYNP